MPYGRASPATQAALFATTQEAKDSRVQAENTCIDSGLMTKADDGSSGRSRMMRKSHVRFPEKGVATYWSFDQHRSIQLWGHPLLYHYYRGMGFETKKDQGSISVFPLYFTWICFYAISYSVDSSSNRNHRFTNLINHRI